MYWAMVEYLVLCIRPWQNTLSYVLVHGRIPCLMYWAIVEYLVLQLCPRVAVPTLVVDHLVVTTNPPILYSES